MYSSWNGPDWNEDGTCSCCGALRPSIAIKAVSDGARVITTGERYGWYVEIKSQGITELVPCGRHFSDRQKLEFDFLYLTREMASPMHSYEGGVFFNSDGLRMIKYMLKDMLKATDAYLRKATKDYVRQIRKLKGVDTGYIVGFN